MIADDVDALVLLAYCYHTCELASPVYMVSPVQQQINIDIAGGKSLSLIGNVTAHLRPQRLHCKQHNSSQHIMVNMLRGALIWQNEGRNSRTTTLVEEQTSAPKTSFTPINISYISWKGKTLPLSCVQPEIGIAPKPSINDSSWIWMGSRHREQNFAGTKPSICNCTGTRLHP